MSSNLALRLGVLVALSSLPYPTCAQGGKESAQQKTIQRKVIVENADVTLSAKDEGFEVIVPGVPEKYLSKGDPSIEKPDEIEYDLTNGKDYYSIRHADYDFIVTDPLKIRKLYDLVKQTYFESGRRDIGETPTLISEKDVYLGDKLGRELIVTVNKRVVWFRSFLIQQRLYQLFFSTPLERKTVATVMKEKGAVAAKFFNSLKITRLPPPLKPSPDKQ